MHNGLSTSHCVIKDAMVRLASFINQLSVLYSLSGYKHLLKPQQGFLSPTCSRRPWSGDYKTFLHKPNSFIYKDIVTKFAGNVYGYENLAVQNFSLILKNKMATIANCLKIIKVL